MKYFACVASLAALLACGSSDSSPDAGLDACAGGTGCEAACELGNEFGIGAFCTVGGGQCANTPSRAAPFCTVDNDPDAPAFCTRPCAVDEDCGSGARCADDGGTGPKGCFPLFCD